MADITAPETKPRLPARRLFELDALRGLAVLMMASFHLVFDLFAYFGVAVNIYSGFWFYVGRISAILFMLISGVSSTLGSRLFRRSFIVLGAAMLVTLVSIPIMGPNYVRFGILHFFGTVMLLKAVFEKWVQNRTARLVTALVLIPVCVLLGRFVQSRTVDTFWLLPFGLMYPGFSSFDYYPLFPWAAWFCAGVVLGLVVYKNKKSLFGDGAAAQTAQKVLRPFCFLGRHSLLVYLLHQPLILAILFLLSFLGVL